jgi:hypothetical protein
MTKKLITPIILLFICIIIGWLLAVVEIGIGLGLMLGIGIYYKVFDDK